MPYCVATIHRFDESTRYSVSADSNDKRVIPVVRVIVFCIGICMVLTGSAAGAAPDSHNVGRLRLIGEQRLTWRQHFQDTVVGGLSGLDYSPKTNTWVIESDDRSEFSASRFYTARLSFDMNTFSSVELTNVNFFKQADGRDYASTLGHLGFGGEIADIESIRFDPKDDSIWYSSEGIRYFGMSPFVKHADRSGAHPVTLPMPDMFKTSPKTEVGPRDNLSFEGLTFAPDGESLWVAMEAPLYQDGPVPTPTSGAVSRITHYARNGTVLGQYAYPIDPIPAAPGKGKAADNGISEMLAVDDHRFLILERSGVQAASGKYTNYIRLYEIDTNGATDIQTHASLVGARITLVSKRLVLNLNTLGLDRLDNLEGLAWGPRLSNGDDSLVMVSDDNFNRSQVTQFLAFDVIP
jgi:hypothetical protein